MAHVRRHLTAGLILGWSVVALAAQSAPLPPRRLHFTVFSAQPVTNLGYAPQPNAAMVRLAFYPTARSPRYVYAGPNPLQFQDAVTGEIAAEVHVPPGLREVLLILSPADPAFDRAMRYRVQVVDDGPLRHPPGTLLILNLSGLELRGVIDRRPVTLADGFHGPISAPGAVTLNLRTPFKARSYQAFADTVSFARDGRALLLLLPPYRRGSLEVQSRVLVDAPAPTAAQSAPTNPGR